MSTELSRYGAQYTAERALFSFMGQEFRIRGPEGNVRFFVKQKAMRLKEEINVWGDEKQGTKMLGIKARGIGDFSGTYDVTDAASGEKVGALKREGLKSIIRDEWTIFDQGGAPIGKIIEDSGALAFLRRLLPIIPQTFAIRIGETAVGMIKQRFSLFRLVYDVDFSSAPAGSLDPRLGVAGVVLLLAIEGRQDQK